VLLFVAERGSGYGREIADFWDRSVYGIQRQLEKLESGGVLIGTAVGRTRVYTWNPRWPFIAELQDMLNKAIPLLPDQERQRLQTGRRRPRRRGKPL
jgi:hypothetical protein